jgi:hypothetical protein
MGKKTIYDRKQFKNLTISCGQRRSIDELAEIENIGITTQEYLSISKFVKAGVVDIKGALFRLREVNTHQAALNLLENVLYVYGDVAGKKVIDDRRNKGRTTKTGSNDPVVQFISSDIYSKHGITYESLSENQIDRIKRIIEYDNHDRYPYEWKNQVVTFIKNDLTNYHGRLVRLKSLSGHNTLYSCVLKYGKVEGRSIYDNMNEKKIVNFKNRVAYWLELGFSDDEAQQKVLDIQRDRALKSAVVLSGTSEYSARSVQYWLKKGYTLSDAKDKVYDIQTAAWRNATDEQRQARIEKWLRSLNSMSDEEKSLINLKKGHSPESYMASMGVDYEAALQLSIAHYAKRNNYSAVSQNLFWALADLLGTDGLYFGALNYEKQFSGKCVDFYDAMSNTVIEFYGDYWHANPQFYASDFIIYGKTAEQIRLNDSNRIKVIEQSCDGIEILVVWEKEYLTNVDFTVQRLYNHIINKRKA